MTCIFQIPPQYKYIFKIFLLHFTICKWHVGKSLNSFHMCTFSFFLRESQLHLHTKTTMTSDLLCTCRSLYYSEGRHRREAALVLGTPSFLPSSSSPYPPPGILPRGWCWRWHCPGCVVVSWSSPLSFPQSEFASPTASGLASGEASARGCAYVLRGSVQDRPEASCDRARGA